MKKTFALIIVALMLLAVPAFANGPQGPKVDVDYSLIAGSSASVASGSGTMFFGGSSSFATAGNVSQAGVNSGHNANGAWVTSYANSTGGTLTGSFRGYSIANQSGLAGAVITVTRP